MRFSVTTRLRFLSGTYEPQETAFAAASVMPGQAFWDIGAHVGYYSLLASRAVGAGGTVHAFEPSAANRSVLRNHVRWNALANVTIHDCALADRARTARFGGGRGPASGKLDHGSETVTVETIDRLVSRGADAPDWIKIDVQGAEDAVLAGGEHTLGEHAPVILCATHGPDIHTRCVERLRAWGYVVEHSPRRKIILAMPSSMEPPGIDVEGLLA